MKQIIILPLIASITIFLMSCSNQSAQQSTLSNAGSIKQIILDIHNQMIAARNENTETGIEKYASFCDDSLMGSDAGIFFKSGYEVSHDLSNGTVIPSHDFTFRLLENTAFLSYIETNYELIGLDTLLHNMRITKIFVSKKGEWKMGGIFISSQRDNYTKQVPDINQRFYNDYTGVYQWKPGLADTFFVKDGELYDAMTGSAPTVDFMVSDSEYMSKNDWGKIIFHRQADGKVPYYTYITIDGHKVRIPKAK